MFSNQKFKTLSIIITLAFALVSVSFFGLNSKNSSASVTKSYRPVVFDVQIRDGFICHAQNPEYQSACDSFTLTKKEGFTASYKLLGTTEIENVVFNINDSYIDGNLYVKAGYIEDSTTNNTKVVLNSILEGNEIQVYGGLQVNKEVDVFKITADELFNYGSINASIINIGGPTLSNLNTGTATFDEHKKFISNTFFNSGEIEFGVEFNVKDIESFTNTFDMSQKSEYFYKGGVITGSGDFNVIDGHDTSFENSGEIIINGDGKALTLGSKGDSIFKNIEHGSIKTHSILFTDNYTDSTTMTFENDNYIGADIYDEYAPTVEIRFINNVAGYISGKIVSTNRHMTVENYGFVKGGIFGALEPSASVEPGEECPTKDLDDPCNQKPTDPTDTTGTVDPTNSTDVTDTTSTLDPTSSTDQTDTTSSTETTDTTSSSPSSSTSSTTPAPAKPVSRANKINNSISKYTSSLKAANTAAKVASITEKETLEIIKIDGQTSQAVKDLKTLIAKGESTLQSTKLSKSKKTSLKTQLVKSVLKKSPLNKKVPTTKTVRRSVKVWNSNHTKWTMQYRNVSVKLSSKEKASKKASILKAVRKSLAKQAIAKAIKSERSSLKKEINKVYKKLV